MREQGFDDDAALPRHAPHRRDLAGLPDRSSTSGCTAASSAIEEATDFLVRADRLPAEQRRRRGAAGTRTGRPTRCPTCSGGRCCSSLRADEQRRLGDAFSLKGFHDTLLRNGSLPISFHRRALAGEGAVGR